MKTPIVYYGGKTNMLKHILPLVPGEHRTYAEPFFGGGAVFFGKAPSKVEVINDNLDQCVNFFRVCQTRFEQLAKLIQATLHSETELRRARAVYKAPPEENDPVTRAWAFWCENRLTFSHKITGGFAFARDGIAQITANKVREFTTEICDRLRHAQIFCRDALDVIRRFDAEDTFFYLDPPYANSDCGHYNKGKGVYYDLVAMLPGLKAKWLLSSYPTAELAAVWRLPGVRHQEIDKNLAVVGRRTAGRRKIETLTWNYELKE
ncbi:MAG: DNA adenine methylase [Victivallaceae bacterium]